MAQLDFVEMSDISVNSDLSTDPAHALPSAQLLVTDISVWVECFSLMTAILVARFPNMAVELFAYQTSIIRMERHYKGLVHICNQRNRLPARHPPETCLDPEPLKWRYQFSCYFQAGLAPSTEKNSTLSYACFHRTSRLPPPSLKACAPTHSTVVIKKKFQYFT